MRAPVSCDPTGVIGHWRGRGRAHGAGMARAWRGLRAIVGLGGAGVARAWRGRGAGLSCDPREKRPRPRPVRVRPASVLQIISCPPRPARARCHFSQGPPPNIAPGRPGRNGSGRGPDADRTQGTKSSF
eukprot:gene10556-biopygen254